MIYKTALITGGAIRIGKDICKKLHENGYNIICHYNKSENEAKDLKSELNKLRKGSCEIFSLDLNDFEQVKELTNKINNNSNSLDLLVNNASSFLKQMWKIIMTQTGTILLTLIYEGRSCYQGTVKKCFQNLKD